MAVNKNFVVKNGLEVNTDLIIANADLNQVGIATTNPEYTLHVNGGIGATDSYISGISTVVENFNVGLAGTVFSVNATGIGSIGVGTSDPAYLLEVRSPVSTGQTALYVYGDMRVTGDINLDDITLDDASVQDLTVTQTANVQGTLNVSGITTLSSLGGITTTGATVISPAMSPNCIPGSTIDCINAQPKGLLIWRSLTQWLGGMGIIMLGMMILSRIIGGGMALASKAAAILSWSDSNAAIAI